MNYDGHRCQAIFLSHKVMTVTMFIAHLTHLLTLLTITFPSSLAAPAGEVNRDPALKGVAFDYSCANTSVFVPWSNAATNPNFVHAPRLAIEIDKYKGTVIIDTGSTAFTIAVKHLDEYSKEIPGWKFLSSSSLLYWGWWVKKKVKLTDSNVIIEVEVLAVHTVVTCLGHTNEDGYNCKHPTNKDENPSVVYLGIGHGRRHDGMTECTPDRNPALNVASIDGVPILAGSYNRGYTIDKHGLTIGLTTTTAAGFAFVALTPSGELPLAPLDWSMAPACVVIGGVGAPCRDGRALFDTGIQNMFLRHPDAAKFVEGTKLTITIPGYQSATIAQYSFFRGDVSDGAKGGIVPSKVSAKNVDDTVFVNTGRFAFNAYKFAYDHEHGAFGVQVLPAH